MQDEFFIAGIYFLETRLPSSAGKGLLHVGVHDLHDGDFLGNGSANLPSAIRYWTAQGWSAEISACVYLKVGFNTSSCITENRDQSNKLIPGYGHLLGLAKAGYFWDPSGCQVLGSFATDTDQICYHPLADLAFTSRKTPLSVFCGEGFVHVCEELLFCETPIYRSVVCICPVDECQFSPCLFSRF